MEEPINDGSHMQFPPGSEWDALVSYIRSSGILAPDPSGDQTATHALGSDAEFAVDWGFRTRLSDLLQNCATHGDSAAAETRKTLETCLVYTPSPAYASRREYRSRRFLKSHVLTTSWKPMKVSHAFHRDILIHLCQLPVGGPSDDYQRRRVLHILADTLIVVPNTAVRQERCVFCSALGISCGETGIPSGRCTCCQVLGMACQAAYAYGTIRPGVQYVHAVRRLLWSGKSGTCHARTIPLLEL